VTHPIDTQVHPHLFRDRVNVLLLSARVGQHGDLGQRVVLSEEQTQRAPSKNVTVITGDVNVFDFEEKEKYVDGST
jgi:hypothetical protein